MPERLATDSADITNNNTLSVLAMSSLFKLASMTVLLVTTGCVSLPNGPSVMVLPGSGLSFEQFRNDDSTYQQFAYAQVGGVTANQAAVNSGITTATAGTALGAAAGAAIGGGEGAAFGAANGLLAGSIIGTGAANSSGYAAQQHFDAAYIQCMYAKGHQVPVYGDFSSVHPRPPLSPATNVPPPPPGAPPPPPPN